MDLIKNNMSVISIVKCPIMGQQFRENSSCKAPLTPGGGAIIGALVGRYFIADPSSAVLSKIELSTVNHLLSKCIL